MGSVYDSSVNLPIGSTVVNIVGFVAAAVVEGEWAPAKVTRELRRNDVNGDLADRQLRVEPTAFTATLQCPNSTVNTPNMGGIVIGPTSTNYIITSMKDRKVQGGYRVFEVGLVSEVLPSA